MISNVHTSDIGVIWTSLFRHLTILTYSPEPKNFKVLIEASVIAIDKFKCMSPLKLGLSTIQNVVEFSVDCAASNSTAKPNSCFYAYPLVSSFIKDYLVKVWPSLALDDLINVLRFLSKTIQISLDHTTFNDIRSFTKMLIFDGDIFQIPRPIQRCHRVWFDCLHNICLVLIGIRAQSQFINDILDDFYLQKWLTRLDTSLQPLSLPRDEKKQDVRCHTGLANI